MPDHQQGRRGCASADVAHSPPMLPGPSLGLAPCSLGQATLPGPGLGAKSPSFGLRADFLASLDFFALTRWARAEAKRGPVLRRRCE